MIQRLLHDQLANGEHSLVKPIRLIRLPAVIARVGIKRSMIYRLMSEGRFPRSRSLGPKCAVWVESEIDEWINAVVDAAT
ncbi:MAG: transcriptional regulator [Sphingopyxis sp.]|jgi:prophage regulatory protein|nr:transcriptional regulator [Sphingopyxis sp.]